MADTDIATEINRDPGHVDLGVEAPTQEVTTPEVPAAPLPFNEVRPLPMPKEPSPTVFPHPQERVTGETIASGIRTQGGAEVRRMPMPKVEDKLTPLHGYLEEASKEVAGQRDFDGFFLQLQKEPVLQVRMGIGVFTYAVIREENSRLVVRTYAHVPATFINPVNKWLKDYGLTKESFSEDCFIRPSGI